MLTPDLRMNNVVIAQSVSACYYVWCGVLNRTDLVLINF